jgi:TonB family protein
MIGLAIPLLVLIGFDLGWHQMRSPTSGIAPQVEHVPKAESQPQAISQASIPSNLPTPSPAKGVRKQNTGDDVLSRGGLVVYQNGKVVYREFASAPGKQAISPPGQTLAKRAAGEEPSGGEQSAAPEVASVVSLPAGITGGRLLWSVRPQYPAEAILNKHEGAVALHGTVGPDGVMQDLKVVSGDPLLSQAAVEAVQQWKYEPYRRNGKPVNMPIDITIDFNLPK